MTTTDLVDVDFAEAADVSFDGDTDTVTIAIGVTIAGNSMEGLRRSCRTAPPGWQATPVGELISKLGSFKDPDAIAEFFRTEGVRGERGKPMNCPIQKWLQVMTGQRYRVGAYSVRDADDQVVAPLPFPVFRFVTEFDGGRWRDLATNNHSPAVQEYDAKHASQVPELSGLGKALHEYSTGTKDAAW